MDKSLASQSPDTSDAKPSFRKPSNDASHRKYRRHSPVSGSSSPSSSGGLKRDRSMSPNASRGEGAKTADSSKRARRNDGGRDSFRDYDRVHGRRGPDAREMTERHSYNRSRDYHSRSDDYSHNHRHGGVDDRDYHRYSSYSGRDSRNNKRSEYSKRDGDYDKLSRDDRWTAERGSREKGVDEGSRKRKELEKDRDKDNGSKDHYKHMDREICIERPKVGTRHSNADLDMEQERSRDKDGTSDLGRDRDGSRDRIRNQDDNKETSRDLGDNKLGQKRSHDEVRGRDKDGVGDRDESRSRARDKYKSGEKDSESYKDEKVQHRKREDLREHDRHKEKHVRESERHSKNESRSSRVYRDRDEKKERDRYQDDGGSARKGQESEHLSEKISRNARDGKRQSNLSDRDGRRHSPSSDDAGQLQGKAIPSVDDMKSAENTNMVSEAQGLAEPSGSSATEAEVAHDLNVAKLAAMKAAELVNKNLGVSGYMSADQKKRLLWGSKKATAVEESGNNQWNMAHFSDPDRQEKFNKLMGVKGESKAELKAGDKNGGLLAPEKQIELQQDLEKQYTAGLRRRDGRTVGLGL